MYLHLGSETVVRTADIIGVFDIENTSVSKDTREFLAGAGKRKNAVTVSYDMPKSFTVAVAVAAGKDGGKEKVYISPLSSAALIKRSRRKEVKSRRIGL